MENKLVQAAKNALADLEGIMPEFEPSGDRTHPAWTTIEDLKDALAIQRYMVLFKDCGGDEPLVEIFEGGHGMTDDEVIRQVIERCESDGVTYNESEVLMVIKI